MQKTEGAINEMDAGLKKLFDYQLFSGNEQLKNMLMEAEAENDALLTDDDLNMVSAAGTATSTQAEIIRKINQRHKH